MDNYKGCQSWKCKQCKHYQKFLTVSTMQNICWNKGCFYKENEPTLDEVKMVKVILNGSPVHYRYNMISYDDIVKFTLEDMREDVIYTVTYSKGLLGARGFVLPGNVIPIVDDMIINAKITGNG